MDWTKLNTEETIDFLCEKIKTTTSPKVVSRLCDLIKVLKYSQYYVITNFENKDLNDWFNNVKRLCIDGYFNTKYLIEKYSMGVNKLVGEKKKQFEEFIRDLKAIQYDIENGIKN